VFEIFAREKQSATMGTRDENNKREDRATWRASQLPDVPKNRHVLDRDDKISSTNGKSWNWHKYREKANIIVTRGLRPRTSSRLRMRPKWHFGTRGQRRWIWTVTMRQGFQSTVIIGQGRRGFLQWKFFVSLVFWERHLALLLSSSFWLPFAELTHTSGSLWPCSEGKLLDPSHWTRNNFF
jgi:hypothetical protein